MASANETLDYHSEIESFLEILYTDQIGWVYSPVKTEVGWDDKHWFKWPAQKEKLIDHMLAQSKNGDVYTSPSIFKAPSDKKQAWKGSNHVWIEFDGNAPTVLPDGIPEPSIRIQSSVSGHEHWYWKLNKFQTNADIVEGLTYKLTYTLGADKSGWDCSQVLRSPGTFHQESKKYVKLLSQTDSSFSPKDFKGLIEASKPEKVDTRIGHIPDVADVVAKYKWPDDAIDLFHKPTQPIGSRSSAMTRLGRHCVEMGMTNEECYAIIYNADERWGKFKNRNDREKRLTGLITYCRQEEQIKAALGLNLEERLLCISAGDLKALDVKFEWLYEGLIAEKGISIISGAPGVGKSTFMIRMAIAIILKQDFLIWKNKGKDKPRRVGFVSLEMSVDECQEVLNDICKSLTPEQVELVDKNLFYFPEGNSVSLYEKKNQQALLDRIDANQINFLIIDTLKGATKLEENNLDEFFNYVSNFIRKKRSGTVALIHHNRKPPSEGSKRPVGVEDLYGDTSITAHAQTVISLYHPAGMAKGLIEVIPLKVRMAEAFDIFRIYQGPHREFVYMDNEVTEEKGVKDADDGSNPFGGSGKTTDTESE